MAIQKITSGIIQDGAIAAADIVSVSNTAITGNITSSQIAPNQTLNGNVSVTGTLSASGVTTLANGAVLGTPASGNLANCTGYPVPSSITQGTAVASTSGTSITFSSIPSGVKRITIMLSGISVNASGSKYIIQVGSGSVSTSGYSSQYANDGTAWSGSVTTGITFGPSNTNVVIGTFVLTLLNSNTWVGIYGSNFATAGGVSSFANGSTPNLAGALDRVVITTVAGTATFATGTINILYE